MGGKSGLSNLDLVTYELQLLIKLRVRNTVQVPAKKGLPNRATAPFVLITQWCSGFQQRVNFNYKRNDDDEKVEKRWNERT